MDVLDGLADDWPLVALVREGLELVANARDRAILLEVGGPDRAGRPLALGHRGREREMTPAAVRQVVSRTRRRLHGLATDDERFAPLADLPLAA